MAGSLFHRVASFLRGSEAPSTPSAHCIVFGKHPAWDDHIADLGEGTPLLVAFKNQLYDVGISSQIDSGNWDRLQPGQRVDGFAHQLVATMGGDVIVGQLWNSRDGKGRARYPMGACVECRGMPVGRAVRRIAPRLDLFGEQLMEMRDANEVREAVGKFREEMSATAIEPPGDNEPEPDGLGGCVSRRGLMSVLYHIDRDLGIFSKGSGATSVQARVPAATGSDGPILPWLNFLQALIPHPPRMIAIAPRGQGWTDLILGEVQSSQFYCLKAGRAVIPLTTDIPYEMDGDFLERAGQAIDAASNRGGSPTSGH